MNHLYDSYIREISKISYGYLEKLLDDKVDLLNWSAHKRDYCKKFNLSNIKYVRNFSHGRLDKINGNDFRYTSELITYHLECREKIFRFVKIFNKIYRKYIFYRLIKLNIFFKISKKILQSILKSGQIYKVPIEVGDARLDLAIGFPAHAFSIVKFEKNITKAVYSSLGEYLFQESSGAKILSIDEYERPSRLREEGKAVGAPQINRSITYKYYSFVFFFEVMIGAIFFGFKKLFEGVEFSRVILDASEYINSRKYLKLINDLSKTKSKVNNIYLLPFDTRLTFIGDFLREVNVSHFNYSANVFIPPSRFWWCENDDFDTRKIDEVFEDFNFVLFQLNWGTVGFSNLKKLLDSVKNKIFFLDSEKKNIYIQPQIPVALGYEVVAPQIKKFKNSIAVFDVPPESLSGQIKRTFSADLMANFEAIKKFNEDILSLAKKHDIHVIFKPKYSLTNYSEEYKLLFNELSNKYGDQFELINPYTSMESISELVDMTISYPYTSSQPFFKKLGIRSVYYINECYRSVFKSDSDHKDFVIGASELDSLLKTTFNGG